VTAPIPAATLSTLPAFAAAHALRDPAAPELGRGDGQFEIRVVRRQLAPFRSLVAGAVEIAPAHFQRPSAHGAEGFDDSERRFCGRELE